LDVPDSLVSWWVYLAFGAELLLMIKFLHFLPKTLVTHLVVNA
jgi:hypothetical protein